MYNTEVSSSKRRFLIGQANLEFRNNYIKTTRYNLATFVPLSLLTQFRRYPNIYFLVICVISAFPSVSPYEPASLIIPFIFILLASMVRDIAEDIARYNTDRKMNQELTILLANGRPQETKASSLRVGNVVIIKRD